VLISGGVPRNRSLFCIMLYQTLADWGGGLEPGMVSRVA